MVSEPKLRLGFDVSYDRILWSPHLIGITRFRVERLWLRWSYLYSDRETLGDGSNHAKVEIVGKSWLRLEPFEIPHWKSEELSLGYKDQYHTH